VLKVLPVLKEGLAHKDREVFRDFKVPRGIKETQVHKAILDLRVIMVHRVHAVIKDIKALKVIRELLVQKV